MLKKRWIEGGYFDFKTALTQTLNKNEGNKKILAGDAATRQPGVDSIKHLNFLERNREESFSEFLR